MKFLLIVLHAAIIVNCELPKVQKCKITDATCIKRVGQELVPIITAGIPELKYDVLDEMLVDKLPVDLAGLKINITSVHITGLKGSVIDKLSLDMSKKVLNLVYHADIVLTGKYIASGRLLVLPISGDGDLDIRIRKLIVDIKFAFETKKDKSGREIIELKSLSFTHDTKGGATFNLTNLFNGNKQLSETLLSFMNENWKALSQEFGRALLEKPLKKVFNAVRAFLRSQPIEDIVDMS